MISDDELLTAVRESFAGARLNAPLDATIRRGRTLRARRRRGGLAAAIVLAAGLTAAGLLASGTGQPAPGRPRAAGQPGRVDRHERARPHGDGPGPPAA